MRKYINIDGTDYLISDKQVQKGDKVIPRWVLDEFIEGERDYTSSESVFVAKSDPLFTEEHTYTNVSSMSGFCGLTYYGDDLVVLIPIESFEEKQLHEKVDDIESGFSDTVNRLYKVETIIQDLTKEMDEIKREVSDMEDGKIGVDYYGNPYYAGDSVVISPFDEVVLEDDITTYIQDKDDYVFVNADSSLKESTEELKAVINTDTRRDAEINEYRSRATN